MSSTSERPSSEQTRIYDRASSVVFLKTDAPFGGLSNMAGGFPLHVQGTRIYTSEALYQACRFPHLPEVQRLIIGQASPMTAKMKSKPHRKDSRPDWDRVRVKVMRWCLRVKLVQNWAKFSELLLRTDDRPIVEESRRDDFWGAKPVDDRTLVGMNVLGRLLMELREGVKSHGRDAFLTVEPPDIPEFLLLGRPIMAIGDGDLTTEDPKAAPASVSGDRRPMQDRIEQASLFDAPSAREAPSPAYVTQKVSEGAALGDLKPYSAMKDSGIPWLGEVPEHWEVRPIGGLGALFKGNGGNKTDEVPTGIPCIRYGDLYTRHEFFVTASKACVSNEQAGAYTEIRHGDVLFAASGETVEDIGRSAVNLIQGEARCGGDVLVLRPGVPVVPRYLGYACDSPASRNQKARMGRGFTVVHIYAGELKRLMIPLPPVPEQAAIVRFLDHADRRIRRYIRAKQKLIKLLEEQKQAIIHRAVTRGLDPKVRLKPSGVEWLGDVPEHWEVAAIGAAAALIQTGPFGSQLHSHEYVTGGIPVINPSHLAGGRLSPSPTVAISDEKAKELSRHMLRSGDIVIARRGELGRCALVTAKEEGWICGTGSLLLRCKASALIPAFFQVVFASRGIADMLSLASIGATMANLNAGAVARQRVPLPPLDEQEHIVRFIEHETHRVNTAISRLKREIELVREYRTRLIADVVTGKLDVREAAARLPDEVEEPEPPDEVEAEGDADEAGADDTDAVPEEVEA